MLISDNTTLRPLIVNLARYFGGAEVRVLNLAEEFGPHTCQVVCLTKSPLAGQLKEKKLAWIELPADKKNPELARLLAEAVHQGGFNIIDAQNVQSRWWTLAAILRLQERPALIATVHSSISQEHPQSLKGVLYGIIERLLLTRFDQVITVSNNLHSALMRWKIPAQKISVVPNGVHLIDKDLSELSSDRKLQFGLKPDQLIIGSVGRLEPAKGHIYLLDAIAKLLPQWPQIHCLIVGEGRLHKALVEYVRDHRLEDHVTFTGFQSDVHSLLNVMDIFVLPSLTEGIPLALLEACACARPVIASRVGGVPEVISNGYSGILVEAGDVPSLATAIGALLANCALANQMGQHAKQEVATRFSISSMVQKTIQAYRLAVQQMAQRLK